MGRITDRADKFAQRLVKREPVDERSQDEKMAEFIKTYTPRERLRRSRRKAQEVRERDANK